VGGEILDSFRTSYEDMIASGMKEEVLQTRMDEQHKAIIRDIKNGKYDPTPPDLLEQQAFGGRPLDQAILEYLQQEGEVDTLELVLDQPLRPTFGEVFRFEIRARLCGSQKPVPGAEVTVKLVSSLKKAVGLVSGKTDLEGRYQGEIVLPSSQPGQCAVVVSCLSDLGFDEVKAVLHS
jgi:phosphoglycolate phosphatase-like HAD superfamily hydrolase